MDPSALSHSLGIGAEVFPLLDRPFPVSGVPLMARPPPAELVSEVAASKSSFPPAAPPPMPPLLPNSSVLPGAATHAPLGYPGAPAVSTPVSASYSPPYISPPAAFSSDITGAEKYSSTLPAPCVPVGGSSVSLLCYLPVLTSFPVPAPPRSLLIYLRIPLSPLFPHHPPPALLPPLPPSPSTSLPRIPSSAHAAPRPSSPGPGR